MNNYVGKLCPFCKSEIKDYEEIVVCSDCGMPHHKNCWIENKGCTTFGCLGTIVGGQKFADPKADDVVIDLYDSEPIHNQNNAFCGHCGSPIQPGYNFCVKCGCSLTPNSYKTPNNMNNYYQNNNPYAQPTYNNYSYQQPTNNNYQNSYTNNYQYASQANNYNGDLDTRLIGIEKADYYRGQFEKIRTSNNNVTWNWAACLLSPAWYFYRKMYTEGAIFGAVAFLSSYAPGLNLFITLAIAIFSGMFGNKFYRDYIEKNKKIVMNMPEPQKTMEINKLGGTSIVAIIIYLVVLIFVAIALS